MKSLRTLFIVGSFVAVLANVDATDLMAQVGRTVPGQNPKPQSPPPSTLQTQNPQSPTTNQSAEQQQRQTIDPALRNLIPVWRPTPQQRAFQGFPIFPSQLPGYGSYPRGLGDIYPPIEFGRLPMLPGAPEPAEIGWPRWLKNQSREPLPYQPDLALLVRNVDRVWLKVPDDEAFVPLYFYDKLRAVSKGTQIEVRQVGEFELLLHGGSRVIAQGTTELTIEDLSEDVVSLQVRKLTRLRLEAFGREHRIGLPDGSTVVMRPQVRPKEDEVAAAVLQPGGGLTGLSPFETATPFQPALLIFERLLEPGWRGGRATLWNGGELSVVWQHAFGTTELAGGQRVTFFLTPPAATVPATLSSERVVVEREGGTVRCEATVDGEVSWSGARFSLSPGTVLRLDPLLGQPFALPTGRAPSGQ